MRTTGWSAREKAAYSIGACSPLHGMQREPRVGLAPATRHEPRRASYPGRGIFYHTRHSRSCRLILHEARVQVSRPPGHKAPIRRAAQHGRTQCTLRPRMGGARRYVWATGFLLALAHGFTRRYRSIKGIGLITLGSGSKMRARGAEGKEERMARTSTCRAVAGAGMVARDGGVLSIESWLQCLYREVNQHGTCPTSWTDT